MEINEKIVKKLALLSRIGIKDDQIDEVSNNLTNILNWVSMLEKVDTQNVEPMFSVFTNPLPTRKDEVIPFGTREQVLFNAPQTDINKEFFATPKVVK